jgi:hypothetical protein
LTTDIDGEPLAFCRSLECPFPETVSDELYFVIEQNKKLVIEKVFCFLFCFASFAFLGIAGVGLKLQILGLI